MRFFSVAAVVIVGIVVSAYDLDIAAARARASTPTPVRGALSNATIVMLKCMHAALAARNATTRAPGERDATDCGLDMVSYEMALMLQPWRAPLADVFYALSLDSNCGVPPPPGSPYGPLDLTPLTSQELSATCLSGAIFYVSSENGDDSNPGTLAAPFASIIRALAATRSARAPGAGTACIVLRGSATPHFLVSTQVLTAADSGLVITGYDGDGEPDAWISGGTPLSGLQWTRVGSSGNIYVANVPGGVASIPGLQTAPSGGSPRRYQRAGFPNHDLEIDGRVWIDSRQPQVISRYLNPPFLGNVTQFDVQLYPALKNDSTMVSGVPLVSRASRFECGGKSGW
jgi:hypothetical protein